MPASLAAGRPPSDEPVLLVWRPVVFLEFFVAVLMSCNAELGVSSLRES